MFCFFLGTCGRSFRGDWTNKQSNTGKFGGQKDKSLNQSISQTWVISISNFSSIMDWPWYYSNSSLHQAGKKWTNQPGINQPDQWVCCLMILVTKKWRFPFRHGGTPSYFLHFMVGFSTKKNIYFGVPPFMGTPKSYILLKVFNLCIIIHLRSWLLRPASMPQWDINWFVQGVSCKMSQLRQSNISSSLMIKSHKHPPNCWWNPTQSPKKSPWNPMKILKFSPFSHIFPMVSIGNRPFSPHDGHGNRSALGGWTQCRYLSGSHHLEGAGGHFLKGASGWCN